MKTWGKSVLGSVAAGALLTAGLGVGPAVAAPPTPIGGSFPFECANGTSLEVTYSGKEKAVINKSGVKFLSPGLKATVTNVDTGESATYTITGTLRPEELDDGNTLVRATGRNLLSRPNPNPNELYLISGNVTFVVDADGAEVEPFSGPGRVVDVCEELS